jgi:hypothetical protein
MSSFFKKEGKAVNNFFKKGGSGEKLLKKGGNTLLKVGQGVQKGVDFGNDVLNKIDKTPMGLVLAPEIGVARGLLKTADKVAGGARSAGKLVNSIEAVKRDKAVQGPSYV